ncbi:RHO protein GDP dissociation inhibitor [Opisthorchis viverrini]|uniref:RHO protein GDP dissociation inhibitor n=1 Tax=Opisthorchis viverrini TaxID=6198 RepID=A0A1S8WUF9_OPIVI|nr:RHO protein GDP dissociation inhibitor [Opisthorchis viverrini]
MESDFALFGCALANTTCEAIPIPEGANYHIKVNYYVQRDIVTGLQYAQSVYRGPVRVDRSSAMMGSYAPQNEVRVWKSDTFEAPKGAMHRGTYHIKSRFVDADKNEYVSWKWDIQVLGEYAMQNSDFQCASAFVTATTIVFFLNLSFN